MNLNSLRPSARLLSLSALALACTLGASGCRRRNPMPTPAEDNTIPAPNPAPNPQPQPNQGGPDTPAPAPKPGKSSRSAVANPNLPVTLKSDKASYRRGERVSFSITMRNASTEPKTLSFGSGQNFDLVARQADAAEGAPDAWRWSADKMFAMNLRQKSLRPGEEQTFTASWNQAGFDAQALPAGSYVITGEIASAPRLASNPITVELNQ